MHICICAYKYVCIHTTMFGTMHGNPNQDIVNLDKLTCRVGDRLLRALLQYIKYELINEELNSAMIMETENQRKKIEKNRIANYT